MRVVIAEDLVLLREGLARLMVGEGIEVVGQAGDAVSLLDMVEAQRPDVVVTDVRMPPTFTDEGARAALHLRESYPGIGVVVLSHVIEPTVALSLARARAAHFAYLLKDRILDVQDFVDTLSRVDAGACVIDEGVVQFLIGAAAPGTLGDLTPREREVLSLVAQGFTNAGIARRLVVSERTVDAHTRSLLAKLGLEPNADEHRRVRATLLWLGQIGASTDAVARERP